LPLKVNPDSTSELARGPCCKSGSEGGDSRLHNRLDDGCASSRRLSQRRPCGPTLLSIRLRGLCIAVGVGGLTNPWVGETAKTQKSDISLISNCPSNYQTLSLLCSLPRRHLNEDPRWGGSIANHIKPLALEFGLSCLLVRPLFVKRGLSRSACRNLLAP
jgi:hypothetical protein